MKDLLRVSVFTCILILLAFNVHLFRSNFLEKDVSKSVALCVLEININNDFKSSTYGCSSAFVVLQECMKLEKAELFLPLPTQLQ